MKNWLFLIVNLFVGCVLVDVVMTTAVKYGVYSGNAAITMAVAPERHDWGYYLAFALVAVASEYMLGYFVTDTKKLWIRWGAVTAVVVVGVLATVKTFTDGDVSIEHFCHLVLLGLWIPMSYALCANLMVSEIFKVIGIQAGIGIVICLGGFKLLMLGDLDQDYGAILYALVILAPSIVTVLWAGRRMVVSTPKVPLQKAA